MLPDVAEVSRSVFVEGNKSKEQISSPMQHDVALLRA